MPCFWVVTVTYEHDVTVFDGVLRENTLADLLADLWWWQGIGIVDKFYVDYDS